eukprot:scaffold32087_cov62-Attheya_sp.AAC.2
MKGTASQFLIGSVSTRMRNCIKAYNNVPASRTNWMEGPSHRLAGALPSSRIVIETDLEHGPLEGIQSVGLGEGVHVPASGIGVIPATVFKGFREGVEEGTIGGVDETKGPFAPGSITAHPDIRKWISIHTQITVRTNIAVAIMSSTPHPIRLQIHRRTQLIIDEFRI